MSPNFPGFVAFSCTMGNWLGNPSISHMRKYTIGWKLHGEKSPILWEKYEYHFLQIQLIWSVLLHFLVLWEIDVEIHAFPKWWNMPEDGNLMGKKHPYYVKSMRINFTDIPNTMDFVAFFHTVESLLGNPCISHMLKYTIGWELDGKKAPMLWEKYGYRFPRLSPYHGFCCIFPYCGKFMGKPMHFPYDGIC